MFPDIRSTLKRITACFPDQVSLNPVESNAAVAMGRSKQHRPYDTSIIAAAPPVPLPAPQAPRDAHFEQLASFFATVALHQQPSTPPPPPTASSSAAPQSSTALALAPATRGQPRRSSVPPYDEGYPDEWEQMQRAHHTRGDGYLAAFLQTQPDLRELASTGLVQEAVASAAGRLRCAARHHAAYHSLDAAIAVLQSALSEALPTLTLEHPVVLYITLEVALMLRETEQHEAAIKKLKWIIPRAGRIAHETYNDGHYLRECVLDSLLALGRRADVVPAALECYENCSKARGAEHKDTIESLRVLLCCDANAPSLPPATLIPLLQRYLAYIKGCDQGCVNTSDVGHFYARLHQCQVDIKDYKGAKVTSREMMKWSRVRKGSKDDRHMEATSRHAQSLYLTGELARSISLHSQTLQHHMTLHGKDHAATVAEALKLAMVYSAANQHQDAIEILGRVWETAKTALRDQPEGHVLAYECYVSALFNGRELAPLARVAAEALERGLPRGEIERVARKVREATNVVGVDPPLTGLKSTSV